MAPRDSHNKGRYLDPAYTVIRKFGGPSSDLGDCIDLVAEITGADRTRVYRWMRPKEKGGTGGLIPNRHQPILFQYAQTKKLPVEASDFFSLVG